MEKATIELTKEEMIMIVSALSTKAYVLEKKNSDRAKERAKAYDELESKMASLYNEAFGINT